MRPKTSPVANGGQHPAPRGSMSPRPPRTPEITSSVEDMYATEDADEGAEWRLDLGPSVANAQKEGLDVVSDDEVEVGDHAALLGKAAHGKDEAGLGALPLIPRSGMGEGGHESLRSRFIYLAEVGLATAVYMSVGPALILVNKYILTDLGFRFPVIVSAFGQLASWVFTLLCFRVLRTHELQMCHHVTWRFYVTNMGVVGICSAGAIAFGQGVYLYLSVAFIQILKSLTPVITSLLLVAFNIEHPSLAVWLCVLMISVGAAVASYGELHFSALGTALMMAASVCEGMRLVLSQKILVNLKFPAMEGLYYNSPICAAWMLVAAAIIEMPDFLEQERAAQAAAAAAGPGVELPPGSPVSPWHLFTSHAGIIAVASALGVLVNLSTMLMIQYTGSVSLKLLGTARNAGLVLYAVIVSGEATTATQVAGYAMCIVFFGAYVVAKARDAQRERHRAHGNAAGP